MRPAKTERDLWDNRTNVDPWTQSAALFLQQPVGWQDKAACAGMSQRLFFPGKERGAADAAKAICALCPVSADCLDYARTTRAADGIWGGVRFSRGKEIA